MCICISDASPCYSGHSLPARINLKSVLTTICALNHFQAISQHWAPPQRHIHSFIHSFTHTFSYSFTQSAIHFDLQVSSRLECSRTPKICKNYTDQCMQRMGNRALGDSQEESPAAGGHFKYITREVSVWGA